MNLKLFNPFISRTAQIREFEKKRHEDLTEKVNQLLENVSKGQLEEDLPDELLLVSLTEY